MSKREKTISSDQFFHDLMEGFDEAARWSRGEQELPVTLVSSVGSQVVFYNLDKDELYIRVSKETVETREEPAPGIVLDYDRQGKLVGIKLSHASAQFAGIPLGRTTEKTAA
jgi:uncharacterized protein YuzE